MEFLKLLIASVKFFLPPKSSDTEERQLSWRYKVATTLFLLMIIFVLASLTAIGQFPGVSKGFAMTDQENVVHGNLSWRIDRNQKDIAELKQTMEEMRRDQLDTRLYDTRGRQCAAMLTKNEDALRSEGERLREALPHYRGLTNQDWRIPPCNEY